MTKLYSLDAHNLLFHCPGCDIAHMVRIVGPGPVWDWNGSMYAPTFTPSLIYCSQGPARCHCSITYGSIEFLPDTQHGLTGQRMRLPDWIETGVGVQLCEH